MKVYPANGSVHLVEADIVEPFEARARNSPHSMVRHKEVLFPPHEDVLPLREVAVGEIWSFGLLSQRAPGIEPGPVTHVGLIRRAPCLVPGFKGVFVSDDLAFEERRQSRMVLREACTSTKAVRATRSNESVILQTLYPEVATEIRLSHIDVLNLHFHIIHLAVRLLGPDELAPRA